MDKYKVEIAAPAARMYADLAQLAAGGGGAGAALLESLDVMIEEIIPSSPFSVGVQLSGQLRGLYWISQGPIHIFYEITPLKIRTVSIVSILLGLQSMEQKAEAIVAEMVLSGRIRLLPPEGWSSRRVAAN